MPLKKGSDDLQERMADFQFCRLLEMVLAILKKSDNLDEAIKEIEKLAAKDGE